MEPEALHERVAALLREAGVAAPELSLQTAPGGGNNRVLLVGAGHDRFIAKQYFSHPQDTRNRLRSEFALLGLAVAANIGEVPRPIASSAEAHLGLLEYVEGSKLSPGELTPDHLSQAAEFFQALNCPATRALAADLPDASEACFDLPGHLALVEARLGRLNGIAAEDVYATEALKFSERLAARWRSIKAALLAAAVGPDAAALAPLSHEDRCISPSDFGFHNAIVRPGGKLCFIDFEYAGWDDPAKMIGDFFAQPAVPVPMSWFDAFVERCMSYSSHPERLVMRARLLMPLFRIKWCCILLNEFLPASALRRRFADPAANSADRRRAQLSKASLLLQSIE